MNKHCPECNITWEQEETIYEFFLNQHGDKEKAMKTASLYGHTEEDPKHFSINVVGVEDPSKYDGVSYYKCTNCQRLFDRWTMEEVKNEDN
jgi:hypothetical protein